MEGRTAELATITSLLDDLERGPRALFLEGEAGIGKTTLFDAAVASAERRGMRVVRCRPSQAAVGLSHAGLAEMLDGVDETIVDQLPSPQRRALRTALRWDEPDAYPIDGQTVAAALAGVLRRLVQGGPLLVGVDDLQWLDPASSYVCEYAVRQLAGLPVAVLAAARSDEGTLPRALERAIDPRNIVRRGLGPLETRDIRRLLDSRFGLDLTTSLARRIQRASRGNPLLALEIGRAIATHGLPPSGEGLPIPSEVHELVVARLRALPRDTRLLLLEVAAAAGDQLCTHWRDTALVPAEDAGIVRRDPSDRVVFVHPLYESGVYAAASRRDREHVHGRLAAAADDPETRARHLALAATGPDDDVAQALDHASLVAERRGALDAAADLAEQARRRSPEADPMTADRGLRAAALLVASGTIDAALEALSELLPSLTGRHRADGLRLLGEATLWSGVDRLTACTTAAAWFDEALGLVGDDLAQRALLHNRLAFTGVGSGDLVAAVHHAAAGVQHAEHDGSPDVLSEALAGRAIVQWHATGFLDQVACQKAIALFDDRRTIPVRFRPKTIWAVLSGCVGQLVTAGHTLVEEIESVRASGMLGDVAYLGALLADLARWNGNQPLATWAHQQVAKAARQVGGPYAEALEAAATVELAAYCGRVDIARAGAEAAIGQVRGAGSEWSALGIAGGLTAMELAIGDQHAAAGWSEQVLTGLETVWHPDPSEMHYVLDAIESLIQRDELDRAEQWLAPFESQSSQRGRVWTIGAAKRSRALMHAARGETETAARLAEAAVAELSSTQFTIEAGRAWLTLGQIERRRRQRAAARAAFTRAAETFATAGAIHWEARARSELTRSWAPRTGGELTASEREVATLAADGLSNKEIAARMFVSVRTVEATLTRVYRKLAIRTRGGLAKALQGGDPRI